ncbi:hypothetical protein ACILDU_08430 [Capnocytophaga canimorsus]|uniref:hypothetical protein n=1 Tax=Capnocytophaga canimorsus TaxID=28188 RepID=UPI0037D530B2
MKHLSLFFFSLFLLLGCKKDEEQPHIKNLSGTIWASQELKNDKISAQVVFVFGVDRVSYLINSDDASTSRIEVDYPFAYKQETNKVTLYGKASSLDMILHNSDGDVLKIKNNPQAVNRFAGTLEFFESFLNLNNVTFEVLDENTIKFEDGTIFKRQSYVPEPKLAYVDVFFYNQSNNPYSLYIDNKGYNILGDQVKSLKLLKGKYYSWNVEQEFGYLLYPTKKSGSFIASQGLKVYFP